MEKSRLPAGCISAEGPSGLQHVLEDLLTKCIADKQFAAKEHYVLYQLGQQKALLKIDMSEKPYLFWYGDYFGRPATKAVKETIARFLYEKCGETDINFREEIGQPEESHHGHL
jgi:hypothetical protein